MTSPSKTTGVFYGCGTPEDMNLPEKKFEYVVIVVIDQDYNLEMMVELDWEQFIKFRKWHKTMNAWHLSVTKNLIEEGNRIF